jgi:diguanylate cyclase (GGDEF)-like protein
MPSLWSRSRELSGEAGDEADAAATARRRFIEALRRAEIVTLVNAARSERELAQTIVEELCEVYEAEVAFLIDEGSGGVAPRVLATVGLEYAHGIGLLRDPLCAAATAANTSQVESGTGLLGAGARAALLTPFRAEGGRAVLLGVGRLYDQPFEDAERALLETVTQSVGHALERIWAYQERDQRAGEQAALVRAAKSLNSSLEVGEVLGALCSEVGTALRADAVAAFLGDETEGYVVVSAHGLPDDVLGLRRPPGEDLGGRAARSGVPLVSHAYQEEGYAPTETRALSTIRVAVAVPLRWAAAIRGYLFVGFARERWIVDSDVEFVSAFAELAALACANAEQHAAMREVADRDVLTGCLNQAAFRRMLGEEVSRSERQGASVTLALFDLDGFKAVNDRFGHLAGDAALADVGRRVRAAVREYDEVARYGGDEFAVVLPATQKDAATPVVERVLGGVASVTVPGGDTLSACAGVAEWVPGERPRSLIERADAAMRDAKRSDRPGTLRRADGEEPGVDQGGRVEHRRKMERRDTRRAEAGDIGLAIARETERDAGAGVAAAELTRVLELRSCTVFRLADDGGLEPIAQSRTVGGEDATPIDAASVVRDETVGRCLRERRPALSYVDRAEEAGDAAEGGTELAVPVFAGGSVWGVVACTGGATPLHEQEAALVEAVAEHLGTSMRAAELFAEVKRATIGTAEALAAALEAKDSYTAGHARSIAEQAVEVGMELGLSDPELEDLRYGGIFHDIGKIAVPDAILAKEGPLTAEEFKMVKRHPVVGDEILAPLPYFAGVRRIVRHDHEHWDGTGYPDGLRGPQIPVGARIVLAVDAYHAMTSNRPYRRALDRDSAVRELRDHAGGQFDPEVVEALLRVLGREQAPASG